MNGGTLRMLPLYFNAAPAFLPSPFARTHYPGTAQRLIIGGYALIIPRLGFLSLGWIVENVKL
jgi:hypothetical protein